VYNAIIRPTCVTRTVQNANWLQWGLINSRHRNRLARFAKLTRKRTRGRIVSRNVCFLWCLECQGMSVMDGDGTGGRAGCVGINACRNAWHADIGSKIQANFFKAWFSFNATCATNARKYATNAADATAKLNVRRMAHDPSLRPSFWYQKLGRRTWVVCHVPKDRSDGCWSVAFVALRTLRAVALDGNRA